jgi:hypothetical protein
MEKIISVALPLDEVLQTDVVLFSAFDVCFVFRFAFTSVLVCDCAVIIVVLNHLSAQSRCLFKDHIVDDLEELLCRSAIESVIRIKLKVLEFMAPG